MPLNANHCQGVPKPVTLIVACSENRVIGRAGRLPFDIPEDKAWFHAQTAGQTVIMGQISFDTWPQASDDGRQPIVITSHPRANDPRVRIASNVPAALELAQSFSGEIFVCGGERIYQETLGLADRILMTLVHAEVPGDRWFPEWRQHGWRATTQRPSQDAHFRYTFITWER